MATFAFTSRLHHRRTSTRRQRCGGGATQRNHAFERSSRPLAMPYMQRARRLGCRHAQWRQKSRFHISGIEEMYIPHALREQRYSRCCCRCRRRRALAGANRAKRRAVGDGGAAWSHQVVSVCVERCCFVIRIAEAAQNHANDIRQNTRAARRNPQYTMINWTRRPRLNKDLMASASAIHVKTFDRHATTHTFDAADALHKRTTWWASTSIVDIYDLYAHKKPRRRLRGLGEKG